MQHGKRQINKRRSLSNISIFDLRRRIASLRRADLVTLSSEVVADRIGRVIDQYPFQIRSMQLNGLYRARSNKPGEVFSSASQLWYLLATAVVRPSRLKSVNCVCLGHSLSKSFARAASHGTGLATKTQIVAISF